jgi:hypothetical protein
MVAFLYLSIHVSIDPYKYIRPGLRLPSIQLHRVDKEHVLTSSKGYNCILSENVTTEKQNKYSKKYSKTKRHSIAANSNNNL